MRWHSLPWLMVFLSSCSGDRQIKPTLVDENKHNIENILVGQGIIQGTSKEWAQNFRLTIPAFLLNLSEVIRPVVQVREGPGGHFLLKDFWLIKKESVIVFNQVGSWKKIISLQQNQTGWVHHKTLGSEFPNQKPLILPANLLPVVFSIKSVKKGYLNPTMEIISLNIPKGRALTALKMQEGRNLVWLKESNSVVWMDEKDAQ